MTTAEQFKQALNQTVKSSCLLSGSDPLYRIEKSLCMNSSDDLMKPRRHITSTSTAYTTSSVIP